jgi:hypothetical protein
MNGWSFRGTTDWSVATEGYLTANYRHSPTYATVTFGEVRRKSNFAQVGIECTYGQLYMYIQRGSVEVQALVHTLKPDRPQRGRHFVCYRPAVVFRYFSLVLKSCVNLKLRQSSSVFTCISSRMSCHLFWRCYLWLKHVTATWHSSSVPSACWIGALEVVELAMEIRIFVYTVHQTIHPLIYSRKDHLGLVYIRRRCRDEMNSNGTRAMLPSYGSTMKAYGKQYVLF